MTSETLSAVRARLNAGRKRQRGLRLRSLALSGHSGVLALVGAGALVLAVLGTPRLIAQAILLPKAEGLEELQAGTPVADDRLQELDDALTAARRFDPDDGRLSTDLALVELLQLEKAGQADIERRRKLEAAIADLERGLAEAPANSFAWARLAGARLSLEGAPSPKMLAALRLSYMTGPYADKIMPFRAALALPHWESLDPELARYAGHELIYLWERRGRWEDNQLPLIRLICRTGRTGLLAALLIENHRDLAELDKLYPTYLAPDACAKAAG